MSYLFSMSLKFYKHSSQFFNAYKILFFCLSSTRALKEFKSSSVERLMLLSFFEQKIDNANLIWDSVKLPALQ